MTPEAQRIAILTAQGWTGFTRSGRRGEDGPTGALRGTDSQGRENRIAPNPVRSLDAMHEAVKLLKKDQRNRYLNILSDITSTEDVDFDPVDSDFAWCEATASQRAEALLRALNLWTDS